MAEPMDVDAAAGRTAREGPGDAHTPHAVHAAKTSAPARAESGGKNGSPSEKARDAAPMPQVEEATTLPDAEKGGDSSARGGNIANDATAVTPVIKCQVCGDESRASDVVKVCGGCQVAVHSSCYGDASSLDTTLSSAQDSVQREETDDSVAAVWRCDCCVHGIAESALETLTCVFCELPSNGKLMKHVDASKWPSAAQSIGDPDEQDTRAARFGHALCARWDPHRLIHEQREVVPETDQARGQEEQSDAATTDDHASAGHRHATEGKESNTENSATATLTEDNGNDANDMETEAGPLPGGAAVQDPLGTGFPAACCFCGSSSGTRIKCQKLHCALFFHAMCAHERNGFLEIRRSPQTSPLVQYHAYCVHHARGDKIDAIDVLHKLVSPPVAGRVGRDAVSKLQTLTRCVEAGSYPSIVAFSRAVATVLADLCRKGLGASKADPPAYNVKHLQALQFFLDHAPQLQIVYTPPGAAAGAKSRLALIQELVDDSDLVKQLQKTFDPSKYLGKYAGPVSQVHACNVCAQPFHERQHLFFCVHDATPHVQHWKCTKRRSNSRERDKVAAKTSSSSSSTKKKLTSIALVRNGQWKDVKFPKGLPGISDELICGVCRSDVHAQGLIASRKEGKRAEFERKSSAFVHSGCFQNPVEAPKPSNTVVAKPPLSVRAPGASKAAAAPVKPAASERNQRSNKRNSSALEPNTSSTKAQSSHSSNQAAAESVAPPVLGPPKMERINVQRTVKWLACVAQIIRLAGAVARLSSAAATPAPAPPGATAEAAAESETQPNENEKAAAKEHPMESSAEPHEEAAAALGAVVDAAAAAPEDASSTPPSSAPAPAPAKEKDSTQSEIARLSAAIDAYFDEAMRTIRPFDAYVLHKLETAQAYLRDRSGPGVAVLRMIAQEYTRFVYVKHTRAVEKATNEKRKREEQEAQEQRELERKRLDRDAELALKSQMLAMRKKQRKHVKLG